MEVLSYYRLSVDKKMGDGAMIPKDQELILIKRDSTDSLIFFETCDNENKSLFWASEDEVEFLYEKEEMDEEKIKERNRIINGDFL